MSGNVLETDQQNRESWMVDKFIIFTQLSG